MKSVQSAILPLVLPLFLLTPWPPQASLLMQQNNVAPENVEVVKSGEKDDDFQVDTSDLANRFRFFLDYEKNKEKELESKRKVFRITPPREGTDQVLLDVALTKANMPKPCMAVNCAECKLIRVIRQGFFRFLHTSHTSFLHSYS